MGDGCFNDQHRARVCQSMLLRYLRLKEKKDGREYLLRDLDMQQFRSWLEYWFWSNYASSNEEQVAIRIEILDRLSDESRLPWFNIKAVADEYGVPYTTVYQRRTDYPFK